MTHLRFLVVVLSCSLVVGCASFGAGYEPPGVDVESVQLLEARGLSQRFRVGLRLTNPNRVALPIRGLSYTLALNGHELIDGVSANLPTIAPYGEAVVHVEAGTNLVGALRLINQFMQDTSGKEMTYALRARVDVKGMRVPLKVEQTGNVPLLQ